MFESISRGFGFLFQAIAMARKDGDLLKPSLYGLVVGSIVAVVGAVPVIATLFLGDSDFARLIQTAVAAVFIFAQFAVAYIFSGMTAYLIYGYLAEGDGRMDKAWAIVKRDLLDLLSLAIISTLVKLLENALRGRDRRGRRNPLGATLAGWLNTLWTTATYYILPAMVIEDLSVWDGAKRATELVKKNLLTVAVTEIGVGLVLGLANALLGLMAVALGVGIFLAFSAAASQTTLIIGGVLGVLVAGVLLALISAFHSYVMTAYHTCLFLWARDAEKAVAAGQNPASVRAPAPVAAVLAG